MGDVPCNQKSVQEVTAINSLCNVCVTLTPTELYGHRNIPFYREREREREGTRAHAHTHTHAHAHKNTHTYVHTRAHTCLPSHPPPPPPAFTYTRARLLAHTHTHTHTHTHAHTHTDTHTNTHLPLPPPHTHTNTHTHTRTHTCLLACLLACPSFHVGLLPGPIPPVTRAATLPGVGYHRVSVGTYWPVSDTPKHALGAFNNQPTTATFLKGQLHHFICGNGIGLLICCSVLRAPVWHIRTTRITAFTAVYRSGGVCKVWPECGTRVQEQHRRSIINSCFCVPTRVSCVMDSFFKDKRALVTGAGKGRPVSSTTLQVVSGISGQKNV